MEKIEEAAAKVNATLLKIRANRLGGYPEDRGAVEVITAFGRECAAQAREQGRADGLFEANAVYQMKHAKSAIINGPAMTEVARRGWALRAGKPTTAKEAQR